VAGASPRRGRHQAAVPRSDPAVGAAGGARSPEARLRRSASALVQGSDDRLGARHPPRSADAAARVDAAARSRRARRAASDRRARSRQATLGAGLPRVVGAHPRRSGAQRRSGDRTIARPAMRVTMLVRCLAMMRGGGETRHLAWARELSALGVDVEVITGVPLLGAARYRVDEVPATLVRSPYTRDFVYRFQNRRGFGRLTMTALHVDEEWFCRAAWRHIAASRRSADVVHAHAIHQAARLRVGDMPVVINLPGPPN